MKIALYCKCGGAWVGSFSPDDEYRKEKIESTFWGMHASAG